MCSAEAHQIRGVSATMHDSPFVRTHNIHHLGATTKCSHRITIAHGFGIRGQVCVNAIQRLSPTLGHTKTGYNLVNQQQGTVVIAQVAQALQPSLARRDTPSVADDGLQQYTRELVSAMFKQVFQRFKIIQADDVNQVSGFCGNASPKGNHLRCVFVGGLPIFNIGLPHQFVIQTMETAFDKCNSLASCETSGGANCTHDGLSAGVGKPHFVYLRAHGFDLLDHVNVNRRGKTGQCA